MRLLQEKQQLKKKETERKQEKMADGIRYLVVGVLFFYFIFDRTVHCCRFKLVIPLFFLLWALVLFIIILFFCQAEWWKSRNLLWILLISFSSHDFRVNQEKNRVSIDFTEFCRVFNELEEEVWLHGNRVPEPIESIGLQAPSRFTSWTILYRFFK